MKVNVREAHLEVLFCQKGKAVTLKQTSNEVRFSLIDQVMNLCSAYPLLAVVIVYQPSFTYKY